MGTGWFAGISSFMFARYLRLGRDANQRAQRAGLQTADPRCRPKSANRTHSWSASDERFDRGYGTLLRSLSLSHAVPADGRERLQTPEDRERFNDTTNCILCACCTTSCPSFWGNGKYVGPAAIVQAHRFIFDSRDQAAQERIETLAEPDGVWRCRTIFNCTPACPRDIQVTRAIGEVKLAIQRGTPEGVINVKLEDIHTSS
jgi:ferredoxin